MTISSFPGQFSYGINPKQISVEQSSVSLLKRLHKNIFPYLSITDLANVALVNRILHQKAITQIHHRKFLNQTLIVLKNIDQVSQNEFLNIKIYQGAIGKINDRGIIGQFYTTRISTDTCMSDSRLFLQNSKFASGCKYLNIILINKKGVPRKIDLPNALSSNILNFLKHGRPEPTFCCYDFVNIVSNKYRGLHVIDLTDWKNYPYIGESFLSVGDAVLLHTSLHVVPRARDELRHGAVYLGYKTYISLYGNEGPIVFSSLHQMKVFYGANSVVVQKP